MSAAAKKTAAVIWLHGLGDSGDGWRDLQHTVGRGMPHISWHFPDAKDRPVTVNGGYRMPAWFDLADIPVKDSTPDDVEGYRESIGIVHKLVADAEARGVPSDRIIVGGFSQGAAVTLLAGLSYPRPLAAVVSFSGWLALRDQFPGLITAANAKARVVMCHGTEDDKVPHKLGRAGHDALKAHGSGLQLSWHEWRMGHSMVPPQQELLQSLIEERLPAKFTPPSDSGAAAAASASAAGAGAGAGAGTGAGASEAGAAGAGDASA